MFYDHQSIEKKWQKYWEENQTYKTSDQTDKPKFYVLDMFPYPSGAGLHVGHPLGYIASDIYARYKRHQGFNVLHPIGYDSFGLPAEQYAIQTGTHPAITTQQNITRYEEQLRKIGFSFDWSREVRTSDASYYKWTQWIFIELFHSWYNKITDKAEPIQTLIKHFEEHGTANLSAVQNDELHFTAEEWKNASELDKQDILLNYRLAYRAETTVNWCPALGTVLANDEVKDGKSERGGFPVFQKKMMQWSMRITAYSERLLQGLQNIDWPQPLKDSQDYWIGKSMGAEVRFPLSPKGENDSTNKSLQKESKKFGYLTGGNNSALLIKKAQENRDNPTEAEALLWEQLKSKKLEHKFRRQHLINDFIVDFVCLSKKLIIEVDGGYHLAAKQQISDEERTKVLENEGFEIIRFKNQEVIGDNENVIKTIIQKLESRPNFAEEKLSNDSLSEIQSDNQPLLSPLGERGIEVFTTRPDTIFGATFMVLAPENPLVEKLTTPEQKTEVDNYIDETSKKTERDRMADVKNVSGAFTGSYAVNPFTEKEIPIYISDYVLMGYGTGAVMAVPAHDENDHRFAKKFNLPIINVIENENDVQEESYDSKDSVCVNSDFLNGMKYDEAKARIIDEITNRGIGHGTTNYKQRDAIFSRQRYWGEPVPVFYKDGIPSTLPVSALPLELPEVEKYLPTENGDPPLGNAKNFAWDEMNEKVVSTDLIDNITVFPLELSTMPGWAGSSWYFLRYMDPKNDQVFTEKNLSDYWGQVDLYIGGSEHATGHLLYSRFWNMFLKDRGYIEQDEPFKKLINQGMILGMSAFVFRIDETNQYVSKNLAKDYQTQKIHVDVSLLKGTSDELDIEKFKNWRSEFADAEFILEDGKYITEREVEKMSKSKYNVVNPDDICEEYGADCLRLYEMFLGPLEQSKPWNTQGLSGVYGFLKKFYNLYFNGEVFEVSEEEPTKEEYKVLHTLIKKVVTDIDHFSFNTSVAQFMIAVNEFQKLKTNKRKILEPLAILVSIYAPHISEELWENLGYSSSIEFEPFPKFEEKYLVEDEIEYPVSFNGKMKFKLKLPADLSAQQIEESAMGDERIIQQLAGNLPKKIIIVPKKIINIVT
ncbi:leucine--tRNA ligase [Candidatus Kaistella beijingensis]|uniref:leucine--tRNA ligase n=1 Tax=Candidatus Kaistella beijingensis TaxID=2820270 RepID=UPI001CC78C9C|nr:leucine--tRNA ligase [Candidatus Kaistella beijingensis]UBB89283.1 leucine--tRNA ligase [Candidatus Kaistella beijingensis]